MTARSTRNKLRWQVERAVGCIDRSVEHLARLDAIAEEQSDYINKQMPALIVMMDGVKDVLNRFREGL